MAITRVTGRKSWTLKLIGRQVLNTCRTRGGGVPNQLLSVGRRTVLTRLACAPLLWLSSQLQAKTRVQSVRVYPQDPFLVYIELDTLPIDARMFQLQNPLRLVIDLADSHLDISSVPVSMDNTIVQRVRFGRQAERHLRIVFDLNQPVFPGYEFERSADGYRMIVNLRSPGAMSSAQVLPKASAAPRELIVVIDAGHGGKDPGALGRRKSLEKDITLDIAKRLYALLSEEDGVRPMLVRDTDVYVGLRERIKFARDHKADLFVSIHADAVPRVEAEGSSVYALSSKGASSETAQWLADNEKRGDLFGDVSLDGRSKDVQQTLIELAQNSTLESSIELGAHLLAELDRIGPLHKETVEQANFAVLKAPDIPSILVEVAFISNPSEERKLSKTSFRNKLAKALRTGIMNFLQHRAPIGTVLATQRDNAKG